MASISQELREAVLQAAIQGKLTDQRPEDGDALDLLVQIKAEKERLIKEKKIKKEKPLAPITEDEVPFDIPENWTYIRLGDLFTLINGDRGKNYPSKEKLHDTGEIPFISAINMDNMTIKQDGLLYVNQEQYDALGSGKLQKNDFVFCLRGSLGKFCIYPYNKGAIASSLVILRKNWSVADGYISAYLGSPLIVTQIHESDNGTAQPNLGARDIAEYVIPLPPLAEQHRIVARVEELMAKIDELEKVEKELEALHQAFPRDMKAALLQAAMQGKLTEQLPEDGNAEDLLRQIKTEKDRLIKEKKIKKEKPLDPITEDEVPFDIPENWKWCYLGDIFNHNAGKALNARNTDGEKHKYITTSNVYWDHFELDNLREMYYTPDEVEKYSVRKGDLLVLEGGDVGRTAIWDREETYCVQNHVHRLRPYLELAVKYFYYCMMYYKNNGMINGKGIAIQGLSANALHCINIPLPPLTEQRRIVERLDKLLPLCDSLQTEL